MRFLDPLDKNHPAHPYKEQVQKWRDQILLEEAERRAPNFKSSVKEFREPQNNGERQYVAFETVATKEVDEGNELAAMAHWKEMAGLLKPDDHEERKWYLIALKRARELEVKISERRAFVIDQLARADAALQAGRPTEAVTIRAMLKDKFGHYTDLADLLGAPSGREAGTPRPLGRARRGFTPRRVTAACSSTSATRASRWKHRFQQARAPPWLRRVAGQVV